MKLFSLFRKKEKQFAYTCSCCGKVYNEMPLCFGGDFPDYYFDIPPEEKEKRIVLKESLCIVDDKHFFHRGRIIIPIINHQEDLVFNVWTSISEENFWLRNDLWNDPNRVNQKPYFGWLQNTIPTYEDTVNIKTVAHEQEVDLTPKIEVIEERHPLTLDQQNGITFKQAVKKVEEILKQFHETENQQF